jgi:hypothetical protein
MNLVLLLLALVPFVSQEGVGADKYRFDCGPATVAMVVGHYTGRVLRPDDLMDIIGTDRYTFAGELQYLLGKHGLQAQVKSFKNIDEVISLAQFDPVILLTYNHWILVTGGTWTQVRYHDSLLGPNIFEDKYLIQSRWLYSSMRYQGIVVTHVFNKDLMGVEEGL